MEETSEKEVLMPHLALYATPASKSTRSRKSIESSDLTAAVCAAIKYCGRERATDAISHSTLSLPFVIAREITEGNRSVFLIRLLEDSFSSMSVRDCPKVASL